MGFSGMFFPCKYLEYNRFEVYFLFTMTEGKLFEMKFH
jgi:hypothetical protein